MAVVVGEELAQGVVVFSVGARQRAHEGAAAAAVPRTARGRADEGVEQGLRLEPGRSGAASSAAGRWALRSSAPAEDLVDEFSFEPKW